jgi:hypothetical protein
MMVMMSLLLVGGPSVYVSLPSIIKQTSSEKHLEDVIWIEVFFGVSLSISLVKVLLGTVLIINSALVSIA